MLNAFQALLQGVACQEQDGQSGMGFCVRRVLPLGDANNARRGVRTVRKECNIPFVHTKSRYFCYNTCSLSSRRPPSPTLLPSRAELPGQAAQKNHILHLGCLSRCHSHHLVHVHFFLLLPAAARRPGAWRAPSTSAGGRRRSQRATGAPGLPYGGGGHREGFREVVGKGRDEGDFHWGTWGRRYCSSGLGATQSVPPLEPLRRRHALWRRARKRLPQDMPSDQDSGKLSATNAPRNR